MKYLLTINTTLILLVTLFASHMALKLLSPFPFDNQSNFNVLITVIAICGLSSYGFLVDEKYFKYSKKTVASKIILSIVEITTFSYMSIIFFEVWEWHSSAEMPQYHYGNPKVGILFFIFKLIRAIEVYWWGIIFLCLGVIFFFIAKKNIDLFKNEFTSIKIEESQIKKRPNRKKND